MFRHSQGDFRTDRKPCISRFHRLSVINHQHRGEGRGIGGVAVVVRKPKPPTNKANFRFVVYKIVEIACIGTRWNEKNNRRSGLRLFVCLLNPLADFAPIRGIAKYCTPATFQEDLSPSVSGVKYSGHFAVLSVAAASSVKENSSFSLSKKSCGVHQHIFLEDNKALFIRPPSLSAIPVQGVRSSGARRGCQRLPARSLRPACPRRCPFPFDNRKGAQLRKYKPFCPIRKNCFSFPPSAITMSRVARISSSDISTKRECLCVLIIVARLAFRFNDCPRFRINLELPRALCGGLPLLPCSRRSRETAHCRVSSCRRWTNCALITSHGIITA